MKKSSSLLDYSFPGLPTDVWQADGTLLPYHKDFILKLLNSFYKSYGLKKPEQWVADITVIGSLTTNKFLRSSDFDCHVVVDVEKFKETNMPKATTEKALETLDNARKEWDRAKVLMPFGQHPMELYFENPEKPSNTELVGRYSVMQNKWLKEPISFPQDADYEESKRKVIEEAKALANELDASFSEIDRSIKRIEELKEVAAAWPKEKRKLYQEKIQKKLDTIEDEIEKTIEIKDALVDERHAKQDPLSENEVKFKFLARFFYFAIIGDLKDILESEGEITQEELPLIERVINQAEQDNKFFKFGAFLKKANEDFMNQIYVDFDHTIANELSDHAIGEPTPGVKEALAKLKELGYTVVIYSARCNTEEGCKDVVEFLKKHEISYDKIYDGQKPLAFRYIDDRAIQFTGNWSDVVQQVEKAEKKASLHIKAVDAYYHGGSGASIRQMAKDGYVMAPLETGNKYQSPLAGRSYLTKDLGYALIYALGGDVAGQDVSDLDFIKGEGGIVLVAPNEETLIPDEDWLGAKLCDGYELLSEKKPISDPLFSQLTQLPVLRPVFDKMAKARDLWSAAYQSMIGKMAIRILMKSFPEYLKTLAKESHSMSHEGNLKVLKAWVFDKQRDNSKLKRDGSNFFEIAQEIPVTSDKLVHASLDSKYWLDPNGKEYKVEGSRSWEPVVGHLGWIEANRALLTETYGFEFPSEYWGKSQGVDEIAETMLANGWTRITNEADNDFDAEVSDLSHLPNYLDNFIAKHYTGGSIGIDDLDGNYVVVSDPFPSIQKQVNRTLQQKVHASLDKDAAYDHAYWIDPNGKIYEVRGEKGNEDGPSTTHHKWVNDNADMLRDEYGVVPTKSQYGENLGTKELLDKGWIRIGDGFNSDWGITVHDINNIPTTVDNALAQFAPEGSQITIEDNKWENAVLFQWPVKSVQNEVQKALRRRKEKPAFEPALAASLSKKDITAQTKKVKQGDYGCLMAVVPHDIAQDVVAWGVRNIPDDALYLDEDGRLGRELDSHVTIKYGLVDDDAKTARQLFNNEKPFNVKLGKVKHFEPPELPFDVVTIEVVSADLERMNKEVCDKLECAEGLPSDEYHPHITVAYVKRGTGKNFIGSADFDNKEIVLDTVIFSPARGNKTYFHIDKEARNNFLPSLVQPADNNWTPDSDVEIPIDPDAESDEMTDYAPCTTGKPRNPEVWRQVIPMMRNPLSKKDVEKESASDPEQEAIEKKELGEDDTLLEYSKGFKDLNRQNSNKPKTTWPDNSSSQGGEPYAPLPSFHVETNPQNENWRFPYKFTRRPIGDDSNQNEVLDMLMHSVLSKKELNKKAAGAFGSSAWIAPDGKIFSTEYDGDYESHGDWILGNADILESYGIDHSEAYGFEDADNGYSDLLKWLINQGWTRYGDVGFTASGLQVKNLYNIPQPALDYVASIAGELKEIVISDISDKFVVLPIQDFLVGGQKAVNKALQQKRLSKQAGGQSNSVPDYLIDEWKTEQIHDDVDSEPYVNHDQRDYPYGMHDSPENTDSGIGWAKDNQPYVVRIDQLQKPADRPFPPGLPDYQVTMFLNYPMSDGMEASNVD